MKHPHDLFAGSPDIATRAELDQLQSARVRPAPERSPAPSPEARLAVCRAQSQLHEERIDRLVRSLGHARNELEHGYAFAALEGHARVDFERSR